MIEHHKVHNNGLGILEDNDINANTLTGVEIKTGAKPTVRGNRINSNAYEAIWVHDRGGGVFQDNDLTGNKAAWDIADDSRPNVTRSDNKEH